MIVGQTMVFFHFWKTSIFGNDFQKMGMFFPKMRTQNDTSNKSVSCIKWQIVSINQPHQHNQKEKFKSWIKAFITEIS